MKIISLTLRTFMSLIVLISCDFGIPDFSSIKDVDISDIGDCCFGGSSNFVYKPMDTLDIISLDVDTLFQITSSIQVKFDLSATEEVTIDEIWFSLEAQVDTIGYVNRRSFTYHDFTELQCLRSQYFDWPLDSSLVAISDSTYSMCIELDTLSSDELYRGRFEVRVINPYFDDFRIAISGITDFEFSLN